MLVAIPLGLVASGGLVYQSSSAAFTASTSSAQESWTAGTVVLSNDSATSLPWTAITDLKPGSTATRCVLVTYTGSLAANVSLYTSGYTATDTTSADLQDVLKFTVQGYDGNQTAATADNCNASLPTALTLSSPITAETATTLSGRTNYAGGTKTPAAITGTHYLTYRITYLVDSAATDDAQADNVAFKFTWEAQST